MASREELIAQAKRKYLIDQAKAKYAKEQGGVIPESVRSEFEKGDLLGPALRVADAPGGFMRTGLANAAGLVSGQGNIVTEEDLAKTAWGEAPRSEEYLKRLGVPEGPSLGGVSARQAAGFVGDVVTDPIGRIAKGLGIAKEISPLSAGAEKAGESMYKSGLKNVDKIVVEKGKAPVSDLLLEARKTGSVEKLSKDASKIGDDLMGKRGQLYQKASDAGAVVDMTAAVSGARKQLAKLRANPGMREVADKLEGFLNKYEGEGFVDIQSVSDWKTALYDSLPQNAFGPNGKVKGPVKAFEKTLSRDFKTAIERAADEVAPGLGKEISKINDKLGTVITAKKPFATEIKKAVTPNYLTVMDAMGPGSLGLLSGTTTGSPVTGALSAAGALALKKGAEASRTAGFRTKGGLLLKDTGESGLLDAGARRTVIDYMKKKDDKRAK